MSTLYEHVGMIVGVLVLVGLGLILFGAVGRIRFPYLGGLRNTWDDFDFFVLTQKQKKACVIIGGLLWALAFFLFVLATFPGL